MRASGVPDDKQELEERVKQTYIALRSADDPAAAGKAAEEAQKALKALKSLNEPKLLAQPRRGDAFSHQYCPCVKLFMSGLCTLPWCIPFTCVVIPTHLGLKFALM